MSEPSTDPSMGQSPTGTGSAAVVDLGSGSVKVLITDGRNEIGRSIKTRLGANLGPNGELSSEALAATGEALAEFAAMIAEHRPATVAAVATAAARTAPNVDELADLVRTTIGAEMEVLSGPREAELSFAGVAAGAELPPSVVLVDLGARSTEFAVRSADGPITTYSLPIGSRTLTEDYLHGDPPTAAELSSALSVVELYIDDIRREMPELAVALDGGLLVGNGAVVQLAAVEIGTGEPDLSVDGYRMAKVDIEEVFRALATENAADRAFNPGLLPEHVDDVVGALCLLVEFLRQFDVEEMMVSERGVRHGAADELLSNG